MPRKVLIDSRELPYHVTARANNREEFAGELSVVWKVLTDELMIQCVLREIRIHAFVLMPNHFHLLLTSPRERLPVVMQEYMGSTTRILNTRHRRWGRVYGAPYNWCLIKDPLYFANALKYVYRNPVRATKCERVCDYPFSTISLLAGTGFLPFPVLPPLRDLDILVPPVSRTFADLVNWLDRPFKEEEDNAIRSALRRREFELAVERDTRRPRMVSSAP